MVKTNKFKRKTKNKQTNGRFIKICHFSSCQMRTVTVMNLKLKNKSNNKIIFYGIPCSDKVQANESFPFNRNRNVL